MRKGLFKEKRQLGSFLDKKMEANRRVILEVIQ